MPVLLLSIYILNDAFVFQHLRPAIPKEPKASPGSLSNFQKQLVADGLGGYGTKAETAIAPVALPQHCLQQSLGQGLPIPAFAHVYKLTGPCV